MISCPNTYVMYAGKTSQAPLPRVSMNFFRSIGLILLGNDPEEHKTNEVVVPDVVEAYRPGSVNSKATACFESGSPEQASTSQYRTVLPNVMKAVLYPIMTA